jgi:integrase
MPRQNRPQRHEARLCWKFTFARKTVYFGRDIPTNERPQIDGIPARAWEWMNDYIRRKAAAELDPEDPTVLAIGQFYLQWAEGEVTAGRMSPANYRGHATHLAKFWGFSFTGDRKARELTTEDLRLFCRVLSETPTERQRVHSPQYIANVCKSIQAAFNWAARNIPDRTPPRLLAENPLKGYRPAPIPVQERYLATGVARRFLRWAWRRGKLQGGTFGRFDRLTVLMLQFLRLTGARPGEACVLQWPDIRWDEEVAIIPPERHKTGKRTGKPRVIHVTPPVARILRAIERLEGHHPVYVFTHKLGRGSAGRGGVSSEGEPWNSVTLASKVRTWRHEAIAAGLPIEARGEKRFVAYILRHSYATDAIQSGLTHAETAELIGNTAQVTEQRYVHPQRKHSASKARQAIKLRRGTD